MYGDVFFTEFAMIRICSFSGAFVAFGRYDASEITGKAWGEMFAIKSMSKELIENSLDKALEHFKKGLITRVGGWELYRQASKLPLDKHLVNPKNFIEIDDFTEDFDFPQDYDNWIKKWVCKH